MQYHRLSCMVQGGTTEVETEFEAGFGALGGWAWPGGSLAAAYEYLCAKN
jgi:hypothetical protein